jgi:dUTP pyrophosphatase
MKVRIKKLNELAVIPTYAKDGDAGMDLVATSIISTTSTQITYGIGLALEIPKGFVGLIFPRSSVRKTRLMLSNCVGVIDSGYRGELQATFNKINNDSVSENDYKVGDRIAQIMIIPHPPIEFDVVDELSDTERGEGGFGSTGK